MAAHMPEMLRFQQRGENIYYTPLSEARHHILIDDMTRESLEKLYEDGFRPRRGARKLPWQLSECAHHPEAAKPAQS